MLATNRDSNMPWQNLVGWLFSWWQPRGKDLPPPIEAANEYDHEARQKRLAWVKEQRAIVDAQVEERLTRLEALAESLRGVAKAHAADTDHQPPTAHPE